MKQQILIITRHAKVRIKERLGLPKRGHNRHIQKVLRQGLLLSRKGQEEFNLLYQGFRYIFKLDGFLKPILITTYKETQL